ncbi:MAG TPA: ABC transporter substrate-binding protein [Streptosporangiaceae bacterium]|nr:ABC transporter substrate-binding protein [Streptosporangiaceae bacterium]
MAKTVIKSAALTCLAGLVLAACSTGGSSGTGSSSSTGSVKAGPGVNIKTKTVTLGVLTPLSGPAALIGKPLTAGQQAYFSYLNAHGGISGWKVNLDIKDDQYNPQLHVQDYNQIVSNVAFIAQSLGSPTTQAIETQAQQSSVILGTAAQSSAFVNQPVNAVIGTPYAIDVANALYYLTHTLGKKNPKVGIVYQNDAYGADGMKGYLAAKAAYHFDDVAHASYAVTDTSFTSQALAMKNAGARYVVVTAIPTAAATLIGTAAAIGYHPQWILQGPAWSEYLMTSTGAAGGKPTAVEKAMTGAWVLGFAAAWGDTSVPGMSQFLAIQKQYDPTQVPDGYYMYGYCMAEMEAKLLAKAIASKNLTRAGLLSAKEHLGTVSFGGLIPTATYTPANGPADRETDIGEVDLTSPGFVKIVQPYFESPAASSMTFAH